MRKKLTLGGMLLLTAVILFLALFFRPVKVESRIAADIYVNGEAVDQTTIRISGEKSRTILNDKMTYIGEFSMESYEPSCRDGVQARITWENGGKYQNISYYYAGDFSAFDVAGIIIDESMTDIAVEFLDGTIVATSEELYFQMKGQ